VGQVVSFWAHQPKSLLKPAQPAALADLPHPEQSNGLSLPQPKGPAGKAGPFGQHLQQGDETTPQGFYLAPRLVRQGGSAGRGQGGSLYVFRPQWGDYRM